MTDITQNITAPDRYLLRTTRRIGMLSYKSARVRFDHRTTVQGIRIPATFDLGPEEFDSFSQFFISSGDQRIELTGSIRAEWFDDGDYSSDAFVRVQIRAGTYYWSRTNNEWVDGTIQNIDIGLDREGPETGFPHIANILIETTEVPAGAEPDIEITIFGANSGEGGYADVTRIENLVLEIKNPLIEAGQNTAIDYQLTQQSNARGRYDDGSIWFGDGPTSYARSAITRDEAGSQQTNAWRFWDETTELMHANILLREVMDMKRTQVRGLTADLLGEYKPCKMPNIDDFFHFFIGGNQNGKDNKWAANLFRLNRVTTSLPVSEGYVGVLRSSSSQGTYATFIDTDFSGALVSQDSGSSFYEGDTARWNNNGVLMMTAAQGDIKTSGGVVFYKKEDLTQVWRRPDTELIYGIRGAELVDDRYFYVMPGEFGWDLICRNVENDALIWRQNSVYPNVTGFWTEIHAHRDGYIWIMQKGFVSTPENQIHHPWKKFDFSGNLLETHLGLRCIGFDIHRNGDLVVGLREWDNPFASIDRYDKDLNLKWSYPLTGTSVATKNSTNGCWFDEDDNVYLAYAFGDGDKIYKLDPNGNLLWVQEGQSWRSLSIPVGTDWFYAARGLQLERRKKSDGTLIENILGAGTESPMQVVAVDPGHYAKIK